MTPLDYTDQQATPLAVLTHAIAQLAGARDASHVVEIIRATSFFAGASFSNFASWSIAFSVLVSSCRVMRAPLAGIAALACT